jgi:Rad3-related DNA helicase
MDMHCRWCHPVIDCPYEIAKQDAVRAQVVCSNTAYFLHEANYVGSLPLNRQLIVIDEADTLEDQLMSFVEVSVTQRKAKEYGINPPVKKTVESAWIEWAVGAEHALSQYRVTGDTVTAIRNRNALNRLRSNIKRLNDTTTGLAAGGWVYTGYDSGNIAFKPIEVRHLATEYIWRHAPRFLLMSATTISFDVLAHTLGLDY